jgi:alpha-galactosidase/6-phospho-beta-glucosidase family protein
VGRSIKLGVIGAGSATFSLGLVRDLCLQESLRGSQVTFMDVDEGRLERILDLAQRYVAELGVDLRFEATVERAVALRDADFVLNTALIGSHVWEEEWRRISGQHGYYRGLRIQTHLHQFEMMVSVARDMERLCPRAWLVQSSNPVFEGCTIMARQSSTRVVGLCHGFYGYRRLAEAIGVPADEVEWQAPGVNHWVYLTEFRHRGRDLYPLIDQWLETKAADYWRTFAGGFSDTQLSRAAMDHYRRVGLVPIGDASRCFSEWYYHLDLATKRQWWGHLGGFDSEVGWAQYLHRLEDRLGQIAAVAADRSKRVTEVFPPERTREIQVPIIDAIANDRPGVYQVNAPNRGAIPGIADDVVVEGKAVVDAAGVHMLQVPRLPEKLMKMVIEPRIHKAEMDLLAYSSGDRDVLVQSVLDDHRSQSLEQAEGVVDAMLALPWNQRLAERFGQRRRSLAAYDLAPVTKEEVSI